MYHAIRIRRLASQAVSVIIHFAHGGLLTTGMIVSIALALLFGSGTLNDGRASRQIQDWLVAAGMAAAPEAAAEEAADVAPAATSGRMRAVAEYVAKKYRVSATAVEPLVQAAQAAGRAAGLDPLLIVAVIGIESGFNPLAESVMGAQGLMQVIPKYHLDKLDNPGDRLALFDPATNIDVGVRVLKESIRRMGSLEAGLQQFAGASDDEELTYTNKVLAEKQRLEQAARRGRAGA